MSRKNEYEKVAQIRWSIWQNDDGTYPIAQVHLALLMDIRGELRKLNGLLFCSNFTTIPKTLRMIARNTEHRKKKP